MTPRFGRRRPTVLGICLLLCSLAAGRAARASTVVLVRSPRPSAVTTEATVRLRGELVSAGFDVQVIDAPWGVDIRSSLEEAAAVPDVEAVVAILGDARGDGPQDSAELWVIDRVTGKTVVRRVSTQGGSRAAEMLSIRALELLRASFLEVALAAGRAPRSLPPRPPPPPVVTRFAKDALVEPAKKENRLRSGWAVELGGCVFGSLDGVSPAVAPLLRIERSFGEHLLARLTLAGLGTQSRLTTPSTPPGTAEVSQQFGLLEGGLRFRTKKILQPLLSVGAGALHVAAVGLSVGTYQNNKLVERVPDGRWTFLADVGAGIRIPIVGRFEAALEAHAQTAQPYPVIRFLGVDVATTGRPTLVGSLSVMGWM